MACDETLYRQYLSGDDAGLEALMKKYGNPLTLYIDGYLHDVHEAEELMLDVFAYLFTKKPRIRDGGFKAYLYKAARHMALRHKSKRKPLFSLDELTGELEGRLLAEEVIQTEERNRILHFCMGEMNPDYRIPCKYHRLCSLDVYRRFRLRVYQLYHYHQGLQRR